MSELAEASDEGLGDRGGRLIDHCLGGVDRDREANALRAAGDGRVDADDLALRR